MVVAVAVAGTRVEVLEGVLTPDGVPEGPTVAVEIAVNVAVRVEDGAGWVAVRVAVTTGG